MAKDRKIVISLSELKRIKQETTEHVIRELMAKNRDILAATAEDDLYLLLVTGLTALAEMGFGEADLYEFADRIADIQDDINDGKRDLAKMEKKLLRNYGLELKKAEPVEGGFVEV